MTSPDSRITDEVEFASSFVLSSHAERFCAIASSRRLPPSIHPRDLKHRSKYRAMLAGLEHWWKPPGSRLLHICAVPARSLVSRLRELGAGDACRIMSTQAKWDGVNVRLNDMPRCLDGNASGSCIVLCNSGRLAFYRNGESEELSRILVLRSP